MGKLTIVLCSVGRRVELARHFVDSVRRLAPAGGRVVGLDLDPLAPALRYVDVPLIVPRVGSDGFANVIRQLTNVQADDSVLVVPLSDREIGQLSDLSVELSASNVRFAVVPPSSVAVVNDKWETMRYFASLGLRTPASWIPEEGLDGLVFPAFVKPREGSAGHGAAPVGSMAELAVLVHEIDRPIVQELLTGDEVTTDLVCGLGGEFVAAISRRRIQVRGGEVMKAVTVKSDEIESACRRIASTLPALGPVTVQAFEQEDGGYAFSEINARLGGGSPLAIAAGVPITDVLVREALGERSTTEYSYTDGLYMTRHDESLFATERDLDALRSRRV